MDNFSKKIELYQIEKGDIVQEIIDIYQKWTIGDAEGPWSGIDLTKYRRKDELISYNDLDFDITVLLDDLKDFNSDIKKRIDYTESQLKKFITKCDLDFYVKKTDKVKYENLDDTLKYLLTGEGETGHDDLYVKTSKYVKEIGNIDDIDPELKKLFFDEDQNLVNYINFLFNNITYNISLDLGEVIKEPDKKIDMQNSHTDKYETGIDLGEISGIFPY